MWHMSFDCYYFIGNEWFSLTWNFVLNWENLYIDILNFTNSILEWVVEIFQTRPNSTDGWSSFRLAVSKLMKLLQNLWIIFSSQCLTIHEVA